MDPDPSRSSIEERLNRGLEPVTRGEWLMAALGALDVLLLVLQDAYASLLPGVVASIVYPTDLALVLAFAVEFVYRSGRAGSRWAYARTHWYDLVGLVPITSAGIRAFRLVRFARIYVVRELDWRGEASWHTAFVRGAIVRFRDVLLEEITTPIVMAGIRMVKAPLARARFASVVGSTIDNQRRQVHAIVAASLRNTKGVNRLTETRAGQRVTEVVTQAVLDTVVDTLRSDEMNDLVANSVEDVLVEVANNVQETTYKVTGGRVEPVEGPRGPARHDARESGAGG